MTSTDCLRIHNLKYQTFLLIRSGSVDSQKGICYNTLHNLKAWANIAQMVEQRFRKPQVRSSSLLVGSRCRGVAQFGSALRSGRRGRRFKSFRPDQKDLSYGRSFSIAYNLAKYCSPVTSIIKYITSVMLTIYLYRLF